MYEERKREREKERKRERESACTTSLPPVCGFTNYIKTQTDILGNARVLYGSDPKLTEFS